MKLRPHVGISCITLCPGVTSNFMGMGDHALLSLLKTIGRAVSYMVPVTAPSPVFVTVTAASSYSVRSIGGSR